ncbi:4Fe-4S dicluster domain-containing protein [Ectobacillus funiculus]|uniref:4Fe-4S dicluster domain-containing protein n=1 Tax=Ectobacillus funiculus TaxID=137993 RepID=A0ABV5WIF5_9BACI
MFDILRKIWRTGTVTEKLPVNAAPSRFRGKPVIFSQACTNCQACANVCPTEALQIHRDHDASELVLSYAQCIFCGVCAEACESGAIQVTNEYRLATKNKQELTVRVLIQQPSKPVTAIKEDVIQ